MILLGGSPRTKRLSLATTLNLDIRNIIFAILHLDSIPQTEEKLSKVLKKKISELVFQRNGKHNKHFFFSRPNAKHELRSNIIDIPPPKKKHKKTTVKLQRDL